MNQIGFLGCGNMGSALARGIYKAKISAALNLYDADSNKIAILAKELKGNACSSEAELFQKSDAIVIAIKPTLFPTLLNETIAKLATDKLVISIAAGITIDTLVQLLPKSRVIRVMPNTPAMCGAGVIAYTLSNNCSDQDHSQFKLLFESSGLLFQVAEKQMDAVTGLSGSGPAYVFAAINALAEGGVKEGLPKAIALPMAAQTFFGAAKLMLESKEHPELLKDRVTSPGGTTAAGLAVLEKRGLRSALIETVSVAAERSRELGKK